MNAFVDAAVILVLLGLAVAGGPEPTAATIAAALVACWVAVVTPALVRSDLSRRRLPNGLTLPTVALVVVAAATSWVTGGSGQDPALALGVVGVVALLGVVGAARGGVGMGDVKLVAALAGSIALLEAGALPVFAGATAVAGGLAVAAVWARARLRVGVAARGAPRCGGRIRADSRRPWAWAAHRTSPIGRSRGEITPMHSPATIPYGPCLLLGYWCSILTIRLPDWMGPGWPGLDWLAAGGAA